MILTRQVIAMSAFVLASWRCSNSEWVDMPQFSDETKIYRTPFPRYNLHLYKFTHDDMSNQVSGDPQNLSVVRESNKQIIRNMSIINSEDFQILQSGNNFPSEDSWNRKNDQSFKVPVTTVATEENVREKTTIVNNMETTMQVEDTIGKNRDDKLSSSYIILNTTSENKSVPTEATTEESAEEKDFAITDYLPVEVLKNVHRILKSQSMSSEGKLIFLKSFDKALMQEIESQLSVIMAPNRRTRGTSDHYDHGYEDHDEHGVGFPSIEGALMAISFLTFAVYLVRLVMLLFRNINNPVQTTTAPTLFLGRRKRSVGELNDVATRLFDSIENFRSKY